MIRILMVNVTASLLVAGCCATGEQMVQTVKPIPVGDVTINVTTKPKQITVEHEFNFDKERKETVRIDHWRAFGDTVVTGKGGTAKIGYTVDSRRREVQFVVSVKPDSIPAGTYVPVMVKERPESFKERWFWVSVWVGVAGWMFFFGLIIILIRLKV